MSGMRLFLLVLLPLTVFGCYFGAVYSSNITKNYLQDLNFSILNTTDCGIWIKTKPGATDFIIRFGKAGKGLKYKNMCGKGKLNMIICSCNDPYTEKCNTLEWFMMTITEKLMEDKEYSNAFNTIFKIWYPKTRTHLERRRRYEKIQKKRAEKEEKKTHKEMLRHLRSRLVFEKDFWEISWYRMILYLAMISIYMAVVYLFILTFSVPRRFRHFLKKKKMAKAIFDAPEFSCRLPSEKTDEKEKNSKEEVKDRKE